MLDTARRLSLDALHTSADVVVAGLAGAVVVFVFWPVTICALGIKKLIRTRHVVRTESLRPRA